MGGATMRLRSVTSLSLNGVKSADTRAPLSSLFKSGCNCETAPISVMPVVDTDQEKKKLGDRLDRLDDVSAIGSIGESPKSGASQPNLGCPREAKQ
jgi:hypothetical protein